MQSIQTFHAESGRRPCGTNINDFSQIVAHGCLWVVPRNWPYCCPNSDDAVYEQEVFVMQPGSKYTVRGWITR